MAQGTAEGILVDSGTRPTLTSCIFAGLGSYAVDAPVDDVGLITGMGFGANQAGLPAEGGTISHTTSWERPTAPIVLAGSTTLSAGVTWSLAPGTVLELGRNASIVVQGTLQAQGNAAAPIVVTSASPQPEPGDWGNLQIDGTAAAGSVLSYVQLFYGSEGNGGNGMLTLTNGANISVSNSVVAQGTTGGIVVDHATRPTLSSCIFAGLVSYAVDAPADDVGLITGMAFGPNQAGLAAEGGTISHTTSWERPTTPIVLTSFATLAAGVTWTLAPGTVLEMGQDVSIVVEGTLLAQGSAAAPIVFTSALAQPKPGDWGNLQIDGTTAVGSLLSYVQLYYGGTGNGGNAMLTLTHGANIDVTNSVVAQGTAEGIVADNATRPTLTSCIFAGLGSYAIDAPVDDVGLITGAGFGANQAGLLAEGGTISHATSWELPAAPIVLAGGTTLPAGVTWTLAPGTILELERSASTLVQGTLQAQGNAAAPIVLTSALAPPRSGDWGNLRIDGTGGGWQRAELRAALLRRRGQRGRRHADADQRSQH